MKNWIWAGVGLAFVVGVGVAWLLSPSSTLRVDTQAVSNEAATGPEDTTTAKNPPADNAESESESVSEAEQRWRQRLSGEFQRVADIYEAKSQYPPYSFPVDEESLQAYRYNHYVPVNVPMDTPAGEVELRLVLEQLHVQKGKPINGMVAVNGPAAASAQLDTAKLIDRQNDVLLQAPLQPVGEGQYAIELSPSEAAARDWARDLLVKVSGTLSGHDLSAVAPVYYEEPVGYVESVGTAEVEGAHLLIPVDLTLAGEGDYRISGDLYSENGRPLVHIEHEARLSAFDDTTNLKIHRSALEAAGDTGPYRLKDLMVRKLPAMPGDVTQFGPVVEESFAIQGFEFDRYADTPYQDPLRQARLEFLRNASEL